VTVAIRPEDILVQDTERTTQNLVRVRITRIDFLGSFVRARLEPADRRGEPLHCDFPVDLLRRMELVPGRTFPIVLPSERLRVYPRPAGHGERS
jgi:iron(III) transport system ATP-binding protein